MARFLLLAFLAGVAPSALAQQMRTDARPVSGSLLPGDGTIDTSVRLRGDTEIPVEECYGFVDPSAPDVVVEWDGGDLEIAVESDFDATLAVYLPSGSWVCDDDTNGVQPEVALAAAPAGRYIVWVGSFSPAEAGESVATLRAGAPPPRPMLDASAAASAGTMRAAGGFEERQGAIEMAIRAGGPDAADEMDLTSLARPEDYCVGSIDAGQPTARVTYDADGGTDVLAFLASSYEDDLVLVVQMPDGSVACNDDFYSTDPALSIEPAASGEYTVWVGVFGGVSAGETVGATLSISETAPVYDYSDYEDVIGDGEVFDEAGYGAFSEGTYEVLDVGATPSARLRTGDSVSQEVVTVEPAIVNPVQGPSCLGYLETAPTAIIELDGDGPFALTASAADDDLTLTVRTPGGGWFCSDDADGLNPGIQIDTPEAGRYLAWVGTFSEIGTSVSATLAATPGELVVSMMDDFGGEFGETRGPRQSDGEYQGSAMSTASPSGTVTFSGGAVSREVGAGGPEQNPVVGEVCGGFIGAQPTLAVTSETSFTISATADEDLTLTIRDPSGAWTCSDDVEGTDPRATVGGGAGVYSVWVGTYYRRTEPVSATVEVSEPDEIILDLMDGPPPPPQIIRG